MATRYSTRSRRAGGSATAEPAVDGLTGAGPRTAPDAELFAHGEFPAFLDMLREASSAPGRVVLLTGLDGAGKRALCDALLDTVDAPWSATWVSARSEADSRHDSSGELASCRRILAAVLDAYGIPVDGDVSATDAGELIAQHAPAASAGAQPCLVVVDDADALPLEDLRALLALAERATLCLVLAGAREIESVVAGMAPEFALELRTIRLASGDAGHPEAPARPAVDAARSGGGTRTRQADERTGRRTNRGRARERHSIAALAAVVARLTGSGAAGDGATPGSGGPFGFPKRHLVALAGLFVVLLVVYIVGSDDDDVADTTQSTQRAEALEMPPLDTPEDVAGPAAAGQGAADEPGDGAPTRTGESSATGTGTAAPAAQRPIISRPIAPAATTQAAPPATQALPASAPATLPAPSSSASAPVAAPAMPAGAPASGGRGIRDARWINAQPAASYTVQLVSLSSAERAAAYIGQQPDPGSYATYRLLRNGQLFHVVVYGNFASKAEADRVAARLPHSVGNIQPWVRPFGQVQESLRSTPQP